MTSPIRLDLKCIICGQEQSCLGLASTNTFGHPDLDLRPPEMKRSSMVYWIQECNACGFCAVDISNSSFIPFKKEIEILLKDEYYVQIWKHDERFGPLASRFIRQSLVLDLMKHIAQAAWAELHGAWPGDDSSEIEGDESCRMGAFYKFKKCKIYGIKFAEQNGLEEAIMIDLLRRASEFEKANSLCYDTIGYVDDEFVLALLYFQRDSIWVSDCGRYQIGDVLESMNEDKNE